MAQFLVVVVLLSVLKLKQFRNLIVDSDADRSKLSSC